jgi:cell division protein FtsN
MMHTNKHTIPRGGMLIGLILGLLVGLGVALAVAVYVMKVPTPFNNKSAGRTPAQDAAEQKKNKDWDPNAALSGKPAIKPEAAASAPAAPVIPAPPSPQATPNKPAQPATAGAPATSGVPAATPAAGSAEVEYFVQVAAFSNEAEAQVMRGKLALAGFEGKIVERDQSGRTVYRVRTGPYSQAAGEKAKTSLEAAGFETVLVRSQK